jgi:hypothetical protein
VNAPKKLVPKGGNKLQRFGQVGPQRRLALDPRFGMRQRLEDATSSSDRPFHDTPIDQKQENDSPLIQRHCRPVGGIHQVVLEVQTCVSNRFLEQRNAMLVIVVQTIMSELADPVASQMCNE